MLAAGGSGSLLLSPPGNSASLARARVSEATRAALQPRQKGKSELAGSYRGSQLSKYHVRNTEVVEEDDAPIDPASIY
jgi:hypothetical protein